MTSRTARAIFRKLRANSKRPASYFTSSAKNQRYDRKIQTSWFKILAKR